MFDMKMMMAKRKREREQRIMKTVLKLTIEKQ